VRAEARAAADGTGLCRAADLPYTTRVVREAMRLYPPVWLLPRVAVEADTVGGEPVPAGADVLVSPYTIHRHPGLWSRPEAFDPDRFAPGRAHPAHAYLPFGTGERACLGSRLALLEAPVFVAAALARFQAELLPGHRVRTDALLTLRPRGGLPLRLRPVRG
jgi:cytochrome P450